MHQPRGMSGESSLSMMLVLCNHERSLGRRSIHHCPRKSPWQSGQYGSTNYCKLTSPVGNWSTDRVRASLHVCCTRAICTQAANLTARDQDQVVVQTVRATPPTQTDTCFVHFVYPFGLVACSSSGPFVFGSDVHPMRRLIFVLATDLPCFFPC